MILTRLDIRLLSHCIGIRYHLYSQHSRLLPQLRHLRQDLQRRGAGDSSRVLSCDRGERLLWLLGRHRLIRMLEVYLLFSLQIISRHRIHTCIIGTSFTFAWDWRSVYQFHRLVSRVDSRCTWLYSRLDGEVLVVAG